MELNCTEAGGIGLSPRDFHYLLIDVDKRGFELLDDCRQAHV